MRKCTILFLSFLFASVAFAQKSVLIIPFDTKMFNNQESQSICEYSGISYDKSVERFRNELDLQIYAALKDSMTVSSLLRSYTTDASSDMQIVHENSQYYFDEGKKQDINKPGKFKPNENVTIGEITSLKTDNSQKLVAVKIKDPQLYSDLVQNYKAQYVVYITQFELLGDYSNPYTVADKSYERTIKVHYVIYNAMGKFVSGEIATTTFSAKVNDIDQICDQYLSVVAKQIARKIP